MGTDAVARQPTPPRVAIAGGGLAGIAAACELADAGYRVLLVERRPYLGGRTFSFVDSETGCDVDNGQHVFMRCCTAYLAFLAKLGALPGTSVQEHLRVPVLDRRGRRATIYAVGLPHPFHLLPSFLGYRHLSWTDKARVAYVLLRIYMTDEEDWRREDGRSFRAWLRAHGQSPAAIGRLWEPIILATCNNGTAKVSAGQGLMVIKTGLLADSHGADLGLPRTGLSELLAEEASAYLAARGAELLLGRSVVALDCKGGRAVALRLADGSLLPADGFISALPFHRLLPVLPSDLRESPFFHRAAGLETAPIVNVNLWYDRPVMEDEFLAFLDSPVQWVFNKGRLLGRREGAYLDVSISGAHEYFAMSKAELQALVTRELAALLPQTSQARLVRCLIIKERHATFVPAPGAMALRLPHATPVPNLFLAGEWTDTGWPSTMESAVRSGLAAAHALMQSSLAASVSAPAKPSADAVLVKG
jgi:squalene-associated FAD-dependent desaturase